jgi:hypothetical protein
MLKKYSMKKVRMKYGRYTNTVIFTKLYKETPKLSRTHVRTTKPG